MLIRAADTDRTAMSNAPLAMLPSSTPPRTGSSPGGSDTRGYRTPDPETR